MSKGSSDLSHADHLRNIEPLYRAHGEPSLFSNLRFFFFSAITFDLRLPETCLTQYDKHYSRQCAIYAVYIHSNTFGSVFNVIKRALEKSNTSNTFLVLFELRRDLHT